MVFLNFLSSHLHIAKCSHRGWAPYVLFLFFLPLLNPKDVLLKVEVLFRLHFLDSKIVNGSVMANGAGPVGPRDTVLSAPLGQL